MREHCFPCRNCGKCHPPFRQGLCPACMSMNESGTKACKTCGFVFPGSPGTKGGLDGFHRTAQKRRGLAETTGEDR